MRSSLYGQSGGWLVSTSNGDMTISLPGGHLEADAPEKTIPLTVKIYLCRAPHKVPKELGNMGCQLSNRLTVPLNTTKARASEVSVSSRCILQANGQIGCPQTCMTLKRQIFTVKEINQ